MKNLRSLLLAAACLTLPCVAQEQPAPAVPVPAKVQATDVTPDEAEKLIAETPGLTIIDVRTPEEFDHGHIKGAVNLNVLDAAFEQQVAALDQTKPVLLHCQSGSRSSKALTELAGKVKFSKVYHMRSGFKGWKDAKKPVEGKPLPGAGRLGPGQKGAPATGK
jgi:phage shock protein E